MLGRCLQVVATVLGVGGLALTALAATATVARGDSDRSPGVLHAFYLDGSNGYEGYVLAGGDRKGEGQLAIFLAGRAPSKLISIVTYAAPATVTDDSVAADLGALGRFSLELVPSGRTKRVRLGCPGEKRWERVEAARYEGTIEFHGEEGFTKVSATGAPPGYAIPGQLVCADTGSYTRGPEPRGGRLEVDRYRGDAHELEMNVAKPRPGARTSIAIRTAEKRGNIFIQRTIGGTVSPGALRYAKGLRTATLRPPAPFSGHGTFRRNARPARQWTGNLSVDLPGRSGVPLTGPGLTFALIRP